jgi:hypothetical protein
MAEDAAELFTHALKLPPGTPSEACVPPFGLSMLTSVERFHAPYLIAAAAGRRW